jgi:hypothetical protein
VGGWLHVTHTSCNALGNNAPLDKQHEDRGHVDQVAFQTWPVDRDQLSETDPDEGKENQYDPVHRTCDPAEWAPGDAFRIITGAAMLWGITLYHDSDKRHNDAYCNVSN